MKDNAKSVPEESGSEGKTEISEWQSQWLQELHQTYQGARRTMRTTVYQAEVVILSVFLPLSMVRSPEEADRERLLLTALFAVLALIWGTATMLHESFQASCRLSRTLDRFLSGIGGVEYRERPSIISMFFSVQFYGFALCSLISLYSTLAGKKFHVPVDSFLSMFR